jgi:nucleosome binding factor SPN SPT16 subunit
LPAKILQQIKDNDNPVPIEILAQAPPKEPTNDAMPKFVQAYSSHSRVATLVKEPQTGKLVKDWETALASANSQPELADMAPSISSMLAVKDGEELVRHLY